VDGAFRVGGGRRAEILETFVRHVAQRGYDQTNLGDIASELHMSKGTIVHHFRHKAQMLREFEEGYLRRQLETLRALWRELGSSAERLAAFVYALILIQVLDRHATMATQREIAQLAGDPRMAAVRTLRAEIQEIVRAAMRDGMAAGDFRPVDADLVTFQLFGASQWMWTWFEPAGTKGPEEIGAAFVSVFVGGVLVDQSHLETLANPNGPIPQLVRSLMSHQLDQPNLDQPDASAFSVSSSESTR
jgi:AcrR family transcriptional regulator